MMRRFAKRVGQTLNQTNAPLPSSSVLPNVSGATLSSTQNQHTSVLRKKKKKKIWPNIAALSKTHAPDSIHTPPKRRETIDLWKERDVMVSDELSDYDPVSVHYSEGSKSGKSPSVIVDEIIDYHEENKERTASIFFASVILAANKGLLKPNASVSVSGALVQAFSSEIPDHDAAHVFKTIIFKNPNETEWSTLPTVMEVDDDFDVLSQTLIGKMGQVDSVPTYFNVGVDKVVENAYGFKVSKIMEELISKYYLMSGTLLKDSFEEMEDDVMMAVMEMRALSKNALSSHAENKKAKIKTLGKKLAKAVLPQERASILLDAGKLQRELSDIEKARSALMRLSAKNLTKSELKNMRMMFLTE